MSNEPTPAPEPEPTPVEPDPSPEPDPTPDPAPESHWTDTLGEEFKGHEHFGVLSKYKQEGDNMVLVPGKMVKSYLEEQKILGAKGVLKPADDASDEAWNQYYTDLGRPAKHTDYNLKRPDFVDGSKTWQEAGSIWNEGRIDVLAQEAHKVGLTDKQWRHMLEKAVEIELADLDNVAQNMEDQYNANVDALTKKWGPQYDKNIDLALKTAQTFGGDEVLEELETLGINGNPLLLEMLYNIGNRIGEHMLVADGDPPIVDKLLSREELQKMMTDSRYTDQSNPEHRAFVRKVKEGYEKLAALESAA